MHSSWPGVDLYNSKFKVKEKEGWRICVIWNIGNQNRN